MEIQTTSIASNSNVRRACFLPSDSGWLAPAPEEISIALERAGMTIDEFANLMQIDNNYARSWIDVGHKVPYAAWSVLCICAGYGQIWRWIS